MKMYVSGAPGYDDFEAEYIMSIGSVDSRGPFVVVGDPETKEIFVIPAQYVMVSE